MSLFVFTTRNFEKAVAKLPAKIVEAYKERFMIFMINPHDPILNDHKLGGQLRGYKSINITGDYRLIYEVFDENSVRLIDIGRHREIYGK